MNKALLYTNNLKNREFDKKGALNLSQATPALKQPNLNKLGDGSGLKDSGCPTPSKTDSSGCLCIWSHAGSFLLLSAFFILNTKCAPVFAPLILIAIAGYAANLIWKKRGFFISLGLLIAASIYSIRSGIDPFWSSVFSASIAVSWLLIFLGKQEADEAIRELQASLSEEIRENIAERERLNRLYAQTKHSLEISEKERGKIKERCETLSQDVCAYQRKEAAFQHAIEDAQAQLLKSQQTNIIPQEEPDPEEKELQHQYSLLREQFEEKSQALDIARKEAFRLENELMALQKTQEEKGVEIGEEELSLMRDLQKLEEERFDLESQVASLQEFISTLLAPKKKTTRSRKTAENQEGLPLLIQEKIDQTMLSDPSESY